MTKKELTNIVEKLVTEVAIAHGAKIVQRTIKVGGEERETDRAEGGMFDLDAARGILASKLIQNTKQLTSSIVAQEPIA